MKCETRLDGFGGGGGGGRAGGGGGSGAGGAGAGMSLQREHLYARCVEVQIRRMVDKRPDIRRKELFWFFFLDVFET